jgi:hypothetical protein
MGGDKEPLAYPVFVENWQCVNEKDLSKAMKKARYGKRKFVMASRAEAETSNYREVVDLTP